MYGCEYAVFVWADFFIVIMTAGQKPSWASTAQVPTSVEQITLSYAPLVRKTAPAVVNIYTRTIVKERVQNPLFGDPFFQRFFGDMAEPPGFRPGDHLKVIDGEDIKSVSRMMDILERRVEAWDIKIDRNGRLLNLMVGQ